MAYHDNKNVRLENNSPDKHKEDRINLLGYITPIIADYAENNRIDPAVCYEACHELELIMIEKCKEKGINDHELEKHKQAAETSFKTSKETLKKDDNVF